MAHARLSTGARAWEVLTYGGQSVVRRERPDHLPRVLSGKQQDYNADRLISFNQCVIGLCHAALPTTLFEGIRRRHFDWT